MSLRALIILHAGFEEIEAVVPIDLLARAGIEVVQAALGDDLLVEGRSGITLSATHRFDEIADQAFDAVILPGGPGISKIRNHLAVIKLLRRQNEQGKLVACICAAPLLLKDAYLLSEINYTAHPSTADELPAARTQSVVTDGSFITSRGAGTATEFSLALIQKLRGDTLAAEIADSICWPHPTL
jgi:4-methyl-5(b-hydroxyethyl)-thiazole monophosphate biosynthesis